MAAPPARAWLLTTFDQDVMNLKENMINDGSPHHEDVQYAVWQIELCPQTDRLHAHVYIAFKKAVRMTYAQAVITDEVAHAEKVADRARSIEYCQKQESKVEGPWEYGRNDIAQGTRSDLKRAVDMITGGKSLYEVAREEPVTFVRNCRGLASLAAIFDQPPEIDRTSVFMWGETGVGKTTAARTLFGKDEVYSVQYAKDNVWMDGYQRQKVLLLDELEDTSIPLSTLLKWADRFPVTAWIKGGSVSLHHHHLIICTNKDPATWWPNASQIQLNAFWRRFMTGGPIKVSSFQESEDAVKLLL